MGVSKASLWGGVLMALTTAACTPTYTAQTGSALAGRAGLTDRVVIERGNQRLLSPRGQACLLSDAADTAAGQALLRTMQAAFNGYFAAVGVESEAVDSAQALTGALCPGASYLLFVHANDTGCADKPQSCGAGSRAEFVVTIVNRGDQSLLDRVKFVVKNSWLPFVGGDQARLQGAFEQLAMALTGSRPE
jgi:hypothetical protein